VSRGRNERRNRFRLIMIIRAPKPGDLAVTENLTVHIAGGCPNCGDPALLIPEDYNDDTIVTCPKCGYEARWKDVFGRDEGF
jgi:predicted RNA-binding Zn-ribbon protein involved in translation (DUF1610 family)